MLFLFHGVPADDQESAEKEFAVMTYNDDVDYKAWFWVEPQWERVLMPTFDEDTWYVVADKEPEFDPEDEGAYQDWQNNQ